MMSSSYSAFAQTVLADRKRGTSLCGRQMRSRSAGVRERSINMIGRIPYVAQDNCTNRFAIEPELAYTTLTNGRPSSPLWFSESSCLNCPTISHGAEGDTADDQSH